MDTTFNRTTPTSGIIKITITKEEIQPEVDKKLKKYCGTARIKGFRSGKIPIGVMRNMVGESIIVEELNKVVPIKLESFINESELKFFGTPEYIPNEKEADWVNEEEFEYSFRVGIASEFDVNLDRKNKKVRYNVVISKRTLSLAIEDFLRMHGNEDKNAQEVQEGDRVYGELISEKKDFNKPISIDLRDVQKSQLKKMLGAKINDEVEIEARKLSENKFNLELILKTPWKEYRKLGGKQRFKITQITHYNLPTIDQEFYDKVFEKGSVTNRENLSQKVKENILEFYEKEADNFLYHQIREELIKNSGIALPEDKIKKSLSTSSENSEQQDINIPNKQYERLFYELRWSLIENKLAKDHNINVEDKEIFQEVVKHIENLHSTDHNKKTPEQIEVDTKNYLEAENGKNSDMIKNQIRAEKVSKFIKSMISTKNKRVSLEEFKCILANHS